MFSSIGWGEILVLLAAGLIILGPERLPGAVSWTMQSVRKVRDYATGATDQLKNELGPEFEDLRKPLSDLNELRGMTPKALITKHLFDGDSSVFSLDGSDGSSERENGRSDPPSVTPVSSPAPESVSGQTHSRPVSNRRPDVTDWDAT
ncbi:MAG: Sec-independent protein translocase protein TatB [Gordonia sp. (in: high G+C Gram-positive bacteria)]